MKKALVIAMLFAVGALIGQSYVNASHDWNCNGESNPYKFSNSSVGVKWPPVQEGSISRASSDYKDGFKDGMLEWITTVMSPFRDFGGSPDLEMFYGNYGNNGWLGLAIIYPSGCTITRGESFLNDFYLQDTFFYSDTNVDHVACQEVGHVWGLDHNRNDNNTCMNDLVLSAGAQINSHDISELDAMY